MALSFSMLLADLPARLAAQRGRGTCPLSPPRTNRIAPACFLVARPARPARPARLDGEAAKWVSRNQQQSGCPGKHWQSGSKVGVPESKQQSGCPGRSQQSGCPSGRAWAREAEKWQKSGCPGKQQCESIPSESDRSGAQFDRSASFSLVRWKCPAALILSAWGHGSSRKGRPRNGFPAALSFGGIQAQ